MSTASTPQAKAAPPSRRRSVANVVIAQLDTAIVTAGSFVVTPAILYGLGDAAYGGWLLINSFISYLRLLDLGTSAGTVKFGAGADGRGDAKDLAHVLNTSSAIFAILATVAFLVTLLLTRILPSLYPNIARDQTSTILILGGALVIDLAFRPFVATLRMRSMHWIHDSVEICSYSVFKLVLVLYFAHRHELSYRMLALLTLGETVVRAACCCVAALYLSPVVRQLNPFRAKRAMVRKLVTMGAAVTVIMIADVVRFQLDAGVIGYFLPKSPQSISIFGVGTRLASVSSMAIGMIAGVLMPRFSGLSESGDKKSSVDLLRSSSLATGMAASFLFVNLAVLGPQFLDLWLHVPWVKTSGHILLLMLPGYYCSVLAGPGAAMLMGRGTLRGFTVLTVAEAIANLLLSIALVGPLGIFGVALGSVIPLVFFRAIAFPLLLKSEVGITPAQYLAMNGRALFIGAIYFVLVGGLMFVKVHSYQVFVLLAAGSTCVFAALVAVAFPPVRAALIGRLRRRARPGAAAVTAPSNPTET